MQTNKTFLISVMTIFASALLCQVSFSAEAGNLYLSSSAGILAPNKISSTTVPLSPTPIIIKYKTKPASLFAFGLGYHISDSARMELEYLKPFFKDITSKGTFANIPYDAKIKTNINALYLKLYYDAFKIQENAKLYLGFGLGTSAIQNKYTFFINNKFIKLPNKIPKLNLSYLLAIGASYDITENIALSIEYNYIDFGKSHSLKNSQAMQKRMAKFSQGKLKLDPGSQEFAAKRFAGSAGIVKLRFSF